MAKLQWSLHVMSIGLVIALGGCQGGGGLPPRETGHSICGQPCYDPASAANQAYVSNQAYARSPACVNDQAYANNPACTNPAYCACLPCSGFQPTRWQTQAPGCLAVRCDGPPLASGEAIWLKDIGQPQPETIPSPAAEQTGPPKSSGSTVPQVPQVPQGQPAEKELQGLPTDKAPQTLPADKGPADKGPADKGPADKGPADKGPADKGPADKGPADKGPADKGASPGAAGPAKLSSGPAEKPISAPPTASLRGNPPLTTLPRQNSETVVLAVPSVVAPFAGSPAGTTGRWEIAFGSPRQSDKTTTMAVWLPSLGQTGTSDETVNIVAGWDAPNGKVGLGASTTGRADGNDNLLSQPSPALPPPDPAAKPAVSADGNGNLPSQPSSALSPPDPVAKPAASADGFPRGFFSHAAPHN